ncbi:MAG: dipeptide epimerase [Chitinophagaceae bacterium]|nr:dipeptide epimerase [Chitinophagaceae bacterium]
MLHLRYKTIQTPFRHPFTTAHGMKTHQPALLISLGFNGFMGFGEAPAIHYYGVRTEAMIETLLTKVHMLEKFAFTEPDRFWHFCHHLFPQDPFLVCALDMAYWDLYAKVNSKKIHEIMEISWTEIPLTDYTIGMDEPEVMLQKMLDFPSPIYKIKVGSLHDLSTLQYLRKHSPAVFRIDANASWSVETAKEIIPQLENLNIDLIEQPLAKENFEDMKTLQGLTSIPFIADESCVSEQDVARCDGYFDGINIKLTKCSGLTPALRMIKDARNRNMKVMMGNMCESEIGSYAMAQFLPLLDFVDLDGPLLLDIPVLKRMRYDAGMVSLLN